jgi:cyclic pyranopterin phosphate synthase
MVEIISSTPGVKKVALSTNGNRLPSLASQLKFAGLKAVNVSVDTLNAERFAQITGMDRLDEVLAGIDASLEVGFDAVKVNAVLLGQETMDELPSFLNWIKERPLTIRLIELMPTGLNQATFQKLHAKIGAVQSYLVKNGWTPKPREVADGPALEFRHPDYQGAFGLIAPYSRDFCKSCNRLRVTSRGALQLCLFAEGAHSLRHLLQHEEQLSELKEFLTTLLKRKEISHYLPEGIYGNNQTFSAVGG